MAKPLDGNYTTAKPRTDRMISVNGDIFRQLSDVQERLGYKLGFVPTLAQTILYLINRSDV